MVRSSQGGSKRRSELLLALDLAYEAQAVPKTIRGLSSPNLIQLHLLPKLFVLGSESF
jgi:hypothetical protein